MDMSQSIPDDNAGVGRAGSFHPGVRDHNISGTPRNQRQMHAKVVSESQPERSRACPVALAAPPQAFPPAAPHPRLRHTATVCAREEHLKARFRLPRVVRRTAPQQHRQHLSTPTKTSGSGAAAIRTGSPLSYSIGH
ncbi:hypothetical protein V8C34DRAFT_322204 [Trichoderma compactum]